MGGYIRRNPRRVLVTTLAALLMCLGWFVLYDAVAPSVGRAVSKEKAVAPPLAQQVALEEAGTGIGHVERDKPLTENKLLSQADGAVDAGASVELVEPVPSDPVLAFAEEILPKLEANPTPLAAAILDAKAAY